MSADGYTWDEAMTEAFSLECGCRGETVDGTFVWTACPAGLKCRWTALVVQESKASGKPYTVLEN